VRGTILRIADLRSQSAYIRVAVRRPTLSRRMVECLPVPHRSIWGDVAAVRPTSRHRFPGLDVGAPSPAKNNQRDEPLVRHAQKTVRNSCLTGRSTSRIHRRWPAVRVIISAGVAGSR
jgi:hypothetical protein